MTAVQFVELFLARNGLKLSCKEKRELSRNFKMDRAACGPRFAREMLRAAIRALQNV